MSGLTAARLRQAISYCHETGVFTWKERRRGVQFGAVAGTLCSDGYISLCVDGERHRAHRLAWLHVHGVWPLDCIDHIDGNRSNNSIQNLRDVSRGVNIQNQRASTARNASAGLLGVTFYARTGQWMAQISVNKRRKHLGYFETMEQAHQAYVNAKRKHHPGCTI